jgi:arylsulfatase A-like enzyme
MPKPFRGVVDVDIRDSVPDWEPFLQPKAPEGAPNVLMIVWDDVGYGAMDVFGGPIETPTMRRIAESGLRYSNFHTTALCSPTRSSLLTGRNATSNNMACITEGSAGFPGFSARIPFENGTIAEVLNEHGWNTYAVGKWHLTPADEVDLSAWKARLGVGVRHANRTGSASPATRAASRTSCSSPGRRRSPPAAACATSTYTRSTSSRRSTKCSASSRLTC